VPNGFHSTTPARSTRRPADDVVTTLPARSAKGGPAGAGEPRSRSCAVTMLPGERDHGRQRACHHRQRGARKNYVYAGSASAFAAPSISSGSARSTAKPSAGAVASPQSRRCLSMAHRSPLAAIGCAGGLRRRSVRICKARRPRQARGLGIRQQGVDFLSTKAGELTKRRHLDRRHFLRQQRIVPGSVQRDAVVRQGIGPAFQLVGQMIEPNHLGVLASVPDVGDQVIYGQILNGQRISRCTVKPYLVFDGQGRSKPVKVVKVVLAQFR
jgi:hypothetical protein